MSYWLSLSLIPPKKTVSKLPTTFPVPVTGSPPIFCKVIRSALALNRTASAAARCVNCSSSWGRPMGDPSASKGASPPLGPRQKKPRLPQLSPLWWVLDGWWVSGSERLTFEVLLKISLTFFYVLPFFFFNLFLIASKWAWFLAGHRHPAVPSSASPWSMLPVVWRPKLLQFQLFQIVQWSR